MPIPPAIPMEWKQFVEKLLTQDETFDYLIDKEDPWLRQEAVQQIVMTLSQGYMMLFAQDRDHPHFCPFINPIHKSAGPNPDYMYLNALVEPEGIYRISGFRGTNLYTQIAPLAGFIGITDEPTGAYGVLDVDTLKIDESGFFSVIFSGEKPEDYEGDWFPLGPEAKIILVRTASYDWINERDSIVTIERLDRSPSYKRPTIDEIAQTLDRLTSFPNRYAKPMLSFVRNLRPQSDNDVVMNDWKDIGGLKNQAYYEGIFTFAEDEAIILETVLPEKVRYWSVLLTDELFNTIDWEKTQSSLNGHQAWRDGDGKFRAVISARDPGVPNWLATGGRLRGIVQGRWFEASSAPKPTLTLVKLSALRSFLPPETPEITQGQREELLRKRMKGAQMRRKW